MVEETKVKYLIWFGFETVGTDNDIHNIEKQLSFKLPKEYKLFKTGKIEKNKENVGILCK